MAYVMMSRLERDTRRTTLLLRNTQAEFYAQGSIFWAEEALRANVERQKGKPNTLVDLIPIKSPVNEVNGYKIVSTIYDMQSRFNLNNLQKPEVQADFKRLLQAVEPRITEQNAQEIALAVTDWVTPAQAQTDNSKYYLNLSPPYRAPHELMVSASELQLVKGMTPTLYHALQPYITALPKETLINAQTAPSPVLVTLAPTVTLTVAKTIEQLRMQNPIVSPEAFASLDIMKNHHISAEKITTTSNYFLLETDVTIENQHVLLYTLLERTTNANDGKTNEGKAAFNILWQSKGVPG
jgi:general secretion pathway protein K